MISRRPFISALLAAPALALLGRPAWAALPEIFTFDGVAIRGADPVAYFTAGDLVLGRSDHALTWKGAEWWFSSEETREAFEMNPEAYAPAYGGHCAYALSKGALAPTVPEAWTIHEGRLFLNFSLEVRDIWSEDIPGNIVLADANWPAVLG